jgi:hypothetical protein
MLALMVEVSFLVIKRSMMRRVMMQRVRNRIDFLDCSIYRIFLLVRRFSSLMKMLFSCLRVFRLVVLKFVFIALLSILFSTSSSEYSLLAGCYDSLTFKRHMNSSIWGELMSMNIL